ncbi:hypothetical protein C1646_756217 [Rhizophagus diaphanus]|nr:hypothetical protein C1646_756217 [Rhizophagus diaphanus] [Rhizophagus sp. MUCL 43196]
MSNVHILNDIKDREGDSYKKSSHRLGSVYEQEFEKKIRFVTEFNSKINDFSEKLLKAKYSAKIKLLKLSIKSLKRELTLAQKVSSDDKVTILSLEAKVYELKSKLVNIKLEEIFRDSNAVGGLLEESAQINSFNPKAIDSFRFELEWVKEDLNSKKHEIESRSNLMEKNTHLQELLSKKDNEVDTPPSPMNNLSQFNLERIPSAFNLLSQIISVSNTEVVPLPTTTPIVTSSLMLPMLIYSILILVLIAIIIMVHGQEMVEFVKKSNTEYSPNQNYFLSPLGIFEAGVYNQRSND